MVKTEEFIIIGVDLRLFDGELNTNITGDTALSDEMKTYYSDYLIDNAQPKLVHDQFGQEHPIPQGKGKTIEFRKWDPLPKAMTPLTEGVTPDGRKLSMGILTATVSQYGDYVAVSDILSMTAIDNTIVQATKLLGAQSGATLDTITREVLMGGTNVQYAEGQVTSRAALVGGQASGNHYFTVDAVRRAVRFLKTQNAEKIGDSFVAIIHPDIAYDIKNDPLWEGVKTYSDPDDIYEGEIGRLEGVRFVETTEARKFPGAGAEGRDVYATLVIADNAYGVTELSGGGLKHIVKPLGSAGTADPLDQRSTVGWKATKTAVRLVEQFMVRIETTSTFNDHVAN